MIICVYIYNSHVYVCIQLCVYIHVQVYNHVCIIMCLYINVCVW